MGYTTPIAHKGVAQNSSFGSGMRWVALTISIVASLSLLGWVMLRCRSGFDFTDEGFYLNWISDPWNYHSSVTQFGFVYHPLYELVGGDIVLLRQINILILFVLGWALCFALLRSIFIERGIVDGPLRLGLIGAAFVAGAGSLSFLDLWLPTPSYNSLTLQSFMVAAIGALLADREWLKPSLAGWILVGIGGCLAFLAKPSSAAMLGCVVAIYLAMAGKFRLGGLSISLSAAILFLAVSALAIDGSLVDFVRRNVDGIAAARRLSAEYSLIRLFRWDAFYLSQEQKSNFTYIFIAAYVAGSLGFLTSGLARFGAALIAIVISGLVLAIIAGALTPKISYEPFQPLQFFSCSFGIVLAAAMFQVGNYKRFPRTSLGLIVFFTMLPYAYAFGTGNNYWAAASRAGVFWFFAGLVVCARFAAQNAAWHQLLSVIAVALVVPTGVLYSAMSAPYRQTEPLSSQISAAVISGGKARLLLPEETAKYIGELRGLSTANGFRTGEPVLDLTGVSPGSLYVMGARPLGAAWALAGYPGSVAYLSAALDNEPCEAIAASWILSEPDAADSFSPEILLRFGADISTDYQNVGSIISNRSFAPQHFEQRLLKPVRPLEAARQACEKAKQMNAK